MVRDSPPLPEPSKPSRRELEASISKAVSIRIWGYTSRIFAAEDVSCKASKPSSSGRFPEFPSLYELLIELLKVLELQLVPEALLRLERFFW
jgi:hypothetical protein